MTHLKQLLQSLLVAFVLAIGGTGTAIAVDTGQTSGDAVNHGVSDSQPHGDRTFGTGDWDDDDDDDDDDDWDDDW